MWRSWVDRINTINKSSEEPSISKEELLRQEQQQARIRDIWQRCNDLLSNEQERSQGFLLEFLPILIETHEKFGNAFVFESIPDDRAFMSNLTKELISGIRKIPEHKSKSESSQGKLLEIVKIAPVQCYTSHSSGVLWTQLYPAAHAATKNTICDYQALSPVEDMVSIEDVGNTMADILKQCVKNASVLHRLITEDTFFMMIRIMTAKPTESVAQDSSSESAYLMWKIKTVDILKSVDMNGEVCQYLHHRRCVDLIIRLWRDCIAKDYLTCVDYREINLGLSLIHFQLERSAKIQFYGLFEEMTQGYEMLLDLSFVGKPCPIPSLSDGLPYQHADFSTPQPRGHTDKIVKNTPAYQCLLASFLYPATPTRHEIPVPLRFQLFSAMKDVIEIHPCNYFVVEYTNSVPQFIESMENYDTQIQRGIMELLTFIMVDLNFVPLKELAVLSLHLQSSSSGKMIALICTYLTKLVKTSPKFYTVVQEAGLINIMSLMLSDVTEKVKAHTQNGEFLQHALQHFDQIIDCIIAMTSTPSNVVAFRKSYRGNLFDLLQYPETRIGALRLFESLSSHAYDAKSPSSLSESPSPAGSPSSPGSEAGNAFSRVMEAIQYIPRDDLDFRLEVLKTIKRIFKAHKSTRDIFRKVGGYVSLVSMIVALEGAFEEPERFENQESLETVQSKIIDVIQTIFSVLAESMHDYDVNKKYFLTNVGYASLENAITLTGALREGCIPHQIFGTLFAFAMDDESVHDLFVEPSPAGTESQAMTLDWLRRIELVLKSSGARVVNPEITPTILNLQQQLSKTDAKLSRAVLCAIYALAQSSRGNQVKLNTSGLIFGLLQRAFPQKQQQDVEPVQDAEREIILQIIKKLMTMGVSYQEILYMFQQFNVHEGATLDTSDSLMDLILQGASRSRWPNFIQFDMGANLNACLELPQLDNFPPANPGYTLLSWIHIEKQDDISNLSLFSVWDDSNLIFKVYIDAATKRLKVYAVSSSKQDAVFKSFEFHAGFWYHLTLVHHKSRLSVKSSSLQLYVNGVLIEQISCPYITQPSVPTVPLRAVIGSLGDEHLLQKPQLVWDLGPTYLMQETLEKETINLFFNLGARYKSLFQDSLRQFQTYEASASLFLTLRSMSKSKSSHTRRDSVQTQMMLANVMKSTHFQSIPEHKMLFAFFACNTLAEGHRTGLTLSGLSDTTLATIAMEINHSHMVINSAIPKLDNAVYMPRNMGYLVGGPTVAYPFGLDESLWKIGGCAIALKLIERSETPETLCKATAILFEIIRYSWRNSEDMERCHGYEILAYLLKQKRDLVTPELIELLLVFIGKNPHSPEDSIINNPLAYRYVILNFEIWKKTAITVQRAQLDQFILFLNTSKLRNFNSKRLPKIHLVKKVLLAFRMNIYAKELVPHLIDALKAIMLSNWTTESIRAVATFLASTVSKVPSSLKAPRRLGRSDSTHSTSSVSSVDSEVPSSNAIEIITDTKNHHSNTTKNVQMRNIVLEMLHDILCDQANGPDYISKFATTITNKWPLLFFAPNLNPFTVVLTARILARICITQGPAYVHKFRSTSEGFLVLRYLLPAYWHLTQLHETLMLMMVGIDVAEYPIYSTFDINHLRTCLHDSKEGSKMAVPDMLPIITAMWDEARKAIDVPATKLTSTPILMRPRTRSNSVNVRPMTEKQTISPAARTQISRTMDAFIQLFDELYDSRPVFKEACNKQDVVDCIVQVLFPSVCPTHQMTADDELTSKDVVLTNFDLDHLNSPSSAAASPIDSPYFDRFGKSTDDDTASIESNTATAGSSIIKRGGTSALMTKTSPHVSKRGNAFMTRLRSASWSQAATTPTNTKVPQDAMMDSLLNFVVDICIESITDPLSKNLGALLLVFSAFPPSSHEQQLLFESYLLTHIAQNLKSTFQLEMQLMLDPRVLANLSKFSQMAADAVIQGRFREGGTEQTYDLLATLLEILHTDEFNSRYGVNDVSVVAIYRAFNRMILVKISDLEHGDLDSLKTVAFLDYCIHHQKIILSAKNNDMEFLKCFCYHLYRYLLSNDDKVCDAAANMWKLLVLQRPDTVDAIFKIRIKGVELDDLIDGFKQMLEMDVESFYRWLDSRKVELNILFTEHISKSWENTIIQENKYSKEIFKSYITRRINKLKKMQKREVYEQEVMMDYTQKTQSWSQSIQEIEMGRFTKALQDFDGHENFISSEWTRIAADLVRERAIWGPRVSLDLKWRLDYTEGPNRMRKRLQYISNTDYSSYMPKQTPNAHNSSPQPIKASITTKHGRAPKSEVQIDKELTEEQASIISKNDEPSTADDDSNSINKDEGGEEEEEEQQISYEEDKNRKVLRLLDQGDMVLEVYNVSQIAGLDACEGLLLLCKNNIYLIDNFFQLSDGEVVEIWDVPKEERDQYLLLVAQAAGMETEPFISSSGDLHTCRKWATADLRDVFKRRFLFRDVALEIFFTDGQNALITVALSERDELYSKLVSRVPVHEESGGTIFGREKDSYTTTGLSNTFRLSSIFGTSTLHDLTQRWERKEITNFQYLMYLNAIAGRSYNDLTQYPVFPWILADYHSQELDLTDPRTFRDLTRPMGAQTAERRQEFAERYRQWGETDDPTPAFHYGTHYSSAMIVCSFLIRLEPFTQHYLKLQGGTFDHADRLFDSIGKAWESASEKNMGDVRELIPEFFYLPEFLTNVNKFNFGVKQGTGEAIDSIVLPPWAHGDPKIFIQRHREALESEYVSAHLHHWIDLIFGFKQQGQQAIDALNVFHHVSYEGAVDLDAITDIVEKTATIGIINNFGQTPRQLFRKPHPARSPTITDPMVLGHYIFQEHLDKLVQSLVPLRDIKQQIESIDLYNEKLGVTSCQQLLMPPDGLRYIEWGFSDNSLRLFSTETGKLLNVFESMHVGFISAACFPDSRTLVTGGTDNLVCIWKVKNEKATTDFALLECLKGHSSVVTTVAASRTYSILVTGSEDKTAIIWDLNRKQYVKALDGHENGVQIIRINDTTGDIITCSGHVIRVWTVNGDLYLTKSACPSSESILSCIFYERKLTEWNSKDLIITGHRRGVVKFWLKHVEIDSKTGQHKWSLVLVHELRHKSRLDGSLDTSDIVALSMSSSRKTLFTGSKHGQVYGFVLPDTSDTYHLQREDKYRECVTCKRAFSVLERKNHCRTCGGIFCSNCMSSTALACPDKSARFLIETTIRVLGHVNMPLNIAATNVSFEDKNESDAVNSSRNNDNETFNSVEAIVFNGYAKQEATTDDIALPPTAKYSKIWIHLRPNFSR
ncbi:beige/BEACH domain-containing protein [Mucor ambiguus]|uniref:Beige/BEACH domain-containing protein n=1 Tax=Mucor ambiguus TaxID=91626 RepID=A0A0C9MGR7_9FUNG|nr:beige/BEACH domain-containing protein [Mucor ambiguus]